MGDERKRSWRDAAFRHRGALLAIPAVTLGVLGRPSRASVALGIPLAFAGEALRCWAVGYSGATTRSDHVVAPALTTAGPYAYVRNPLYAGNFVTALGFTIAFGGGVGRRARVALALGGLGTMLGVYAAIVPLEEAYLGEAFGTAFYDYAARVPRIVPRLTPAVPAVGTYDASVISRAETRTFLTFGAMLLLLTLKALRG